MERLYLKEEWYRFEKKLYELTGIKADEVVETAFFSGAEALYHILMKSFYTETDPEKSAKRFENIHKELKEKIKEDA